MGPELLGGKPALAPMGTEMLRRDWGRVLALRANRDLWFSASWPMVWWRMGAYQLGPHLRN